MIFPLIRVQKKQYSQTTAYGTLSKYQFVYLQPLLSYILIKLSDDAIKEDKILSLILCV